eukprot:2331155-Pleurochrysis_carterae.AAC.1
MAVVASFVALVVVDVDDGDERVASVGSDRVGGACCCVHCRRLIVPAVCSDDAVLEGRGLAGAAAAAAAGCVGGFFAVFGLCVVAFVIVGDNVVHRGLLSLLGQGAGGVDSISV